MGDELAAAAVERARYGRNGIYDVTVYRADDEVIAEFRGHSHQLPDENRLAKAAHNLVDLRLMCLTGPGSEDTRIRRSGREVSPIATPSGVVCCAYPAVHAGEICAVGPYWTSRCRRGPAGGTGGEGAGFTGD